MRARLKAYLLCRFKNQTRLERSSAWKGLLLAQKVHCSKVALLKRGSTRKGLCSKGVLLQQGSARKGLRLKRSSAWKGLCSKGALIKRGSDQKELCSKGVPLIWAHFEFRPVSVKSVNGISFSLGAKIASLRIFIQKTSPLYKSKTCGG